jgi:hypothetical protein
MTKTRNYATKFIDLSTNYECRTVVDVHVFDIDRGSRICLTVNSTNIEMLSKLFSCEEEFFGYPSTVILNSCVEECSIEMNFETPREDIAKWLESHINSA